MQEKNKFNKVKNKKYRKKSLEKEKSQKKILKKKKKKKRDIAMCTKFLIPIDVTYELSSFNWCIETYYK